MDTFFLDTSALFKRYRWEEGSATVEGLFTRQASRLIAEVTLLEVVSNLRRLLDVDRLITDEEFDVLLATFFDDLASEVLQVVRLSHAVLATSLDLACRRYVTPLDAVQLASALALPESPVFVCADQKLLCLAEELGLETVDVSRDV